MAAQADLAPGREAGPLDVRPLTPADLPSLRLGWQSRLSGEEIARLLHAYPGRSVWAPATLEFAIVGPWRHRDEIAHVVDFAAARHPEALILNVVRRCDQRAAALVLLIELDETRRPSFYARVGFELIEEVVTYELVGLRPGGHRPGRLTFVPVDPLDDEQRQLLLAIDHAAFPWLWWNSDLELQAYGLTPGVELFLGLEDGRPVSYLGLTSYPGWGHLDRIAVTPGDQGRGLGREALGFAVETLARRGARRVGLSTQADNERSRLLYERFGFRRSRTNDYRLYGRLLRVPHEGGGSIRG